MPPAAAPRAMKLPGGMGDCGEGEAILAASRQQLAFSCQLPMESERQESGEVPLAVSTTAEVSHSASDPANR